MHMNRNFLGRLDFIFTDTQQ